MKLIDEANIQKVQELLLNRIKGLEWNYFELKLDEIDEKDLKVNKKEIDKFFECIDSDEKTGKDAYKYENESCENLKHKVVRILLSIISSNPELLRNVLLRLFDSNELKNQSDAHQGFMGKLNKKETKWRLKKFNKRLGAEDFLDKKVILAEGDSWFQYPKFYKIPLVNDIVHWFLKDEDYAIYSLAAGGDWLSNIFYSGEYIEELPKVSPDVFLVSGGGNDLVGNNRIATMVTDLKNGKKRRSINNEEPLLNKLYAIRSAENLNGKNIDIELYGKGLELISDDLFTFLNLYLVQYFVFFHSIGRVPKYEDLLFITQGYDFAIPSNKENGRWFPSFGKGKMRNRFINKMINNGQWMFYPLRMRGIVKEEDQKAVIYTMIYEFNEMLIQLTEFKGLPNLFHIDCRGFAQKEDWFDELHLKSNKYKEIKRVYDKCINDFFSSDKTTGKEIEKVYNVVKVLDEIQKE